MDDRILNHEEMGNHPELADYKFDSPVGSWTGRLDFRAWGRSSNLLLFFTDVVTHKKYRLSVFSNNNYQPYESEINFDADRNGSRFHVTTRRSRNNLPKLISAVPIEQIQIHD